MNNVIKYIWLTLIAFVIFSLLALIPIDKYQRVYFDELNRIKAEPQRRVNATTRYVEALENGLEDISNGILNLPPQKYYSQPSTKKTVSQNKYASPKYVRDANNPRILYPVKQR